MFLIPAIDLWSGKVVRLRKGRAEEMETYDLDPVELARRYRDEGARRLHVVDLEGAFEGGPRNWPVIAKLLGLGLEVQVGGGLREARLVDRVLADGATRAVVGTRALTDPSFLEAIVGSHGDRIVIGLDALDGEVKVHGWTRGGAGNYLDVGRSLAAHGVKHLLYTSIGRDGMLGGPDVPGTVELARAAGIPVIASGGVAGLDDVVALAREAPRGLEGVVVGKALIEGRFTVAQAVERLREVV